MPLRRVATANPIRNLAIFEVGFIEAPFCCFRAEALFSIHFCLLERIMDLQSQRVQRDIP
jgi:hypothetical protein